MIFTPTIRKRLATAFLVMLLITTATAMVQAEEKKYPVLLIHGLASSSEDWNEMQFFMNSFGLVTFTMDFNEWDYLPFVNHKNKRLRHYAALISRQIHEIKRVTGADKVNVVAHSIAGLAVRAYIADWGKMIETRGQYSNDINKIIYLGTPQYGFEQITGKMRRMFMDTNWGPWLDGDDMEWFLEEITFGSKEMADLMDATAELHPKYGIEEVTVFSKKDQLIKPHLASLEGLSNNPFYIPRPSVAKNQDQLTHHITLINLRHAEHKFLGNNDRTYINVANRNHLVFKLARQFFTGVDAWKATGGAKDKKQNIVFLRAEKGSGITFSAIDTNKLALYKVLAKRKIRVPLKYWEEGDFFTFDNGDSATYQLVYLVNPEKLSLRFDMNLLKGLAQIAEFSYDNFIPDEEYEKRPGDDQIIPGNVPPRVHDEPSMRQFVLASFPFETKVYKTRGEMLVLANDIKQKLHETYPDLIRKKDLDVFGLEQYVKVDWIENVDSAGIFANKIQWNEIDETPVPITPPKDGGGGGGGGGGGSGDYGQPGDPMPTYVGNAEDLRTFIARHPQMGEGWALQSLPGGKGGGSLYDRCRFVRDELDKYYTRIERLNDWTYRDNNWYSHGDAIFLPFERDYVDFCSDSTGGGSLWYKLTWLQHGVQDDMAYEKQRTVYP